MSSLVRDPVPERYQTTTNIIIPEDENKPWYFSSSFTLKIDFKTSSLLIFWFKV
jgi:hypothetical protein